MNRISRRLWAFALGISLASITQAQVHAWPEKPVRYVVPALAGGITDVAGRLLADQLSKKWGQQVFVDNKVGGYAVVAATDVARQKADGHTLLHAADFTWNMNQFMFAKPAYHPLKDFAHVTQFARLPLLIVSNDKTPAKTLQELVALAKASPGIIPVGGSAPSLQVEVERFSRAAGIKLMYVPYRSGADVFKGLMTGEIAVGFDGIVAYPPMLKSGKLRALATTGTQRALALPDVPTVSESGYKGADFYLWHGLSVPAGTPREVVAKIYEDVRAVVATPEVREKMIAMGLEPMSSTPDEMVAAIRRESAANMEIVKELGIKFE